VILGATSGIGREIAHQYAARGARVCVVGRRQVQLDEVVLECQERAIKSGGEQSSCFGIRADFADVEDMVRLRTAVEDAWAGLDTLIVTAGVSALQPLMMVAGVKAEGKAFNPPQASVAGIQHAVDVAAAATTGNYAGPLVAAITFIPLLQATSLSPSILLLSSLASVIAAPTRSLYGSTKTASLLLYQSLSIEHPLISFSFILPSTVEGDFRAGAVDGGTVREADPRTHGLKREAVARECISAVDRGAKIVFMPRYTRLAHLLYWIWPSFVERRAKAKYRFY